MRSTCLLACAIVSLLLVVPGNARAPHQAAPKITVLVPFDFMVGQMMFPAGEYVIAKQGQNQYRLWARRGIESVRFTGVPSRTPSYAHTPSLNFVEEKHHFQLRQIWVNSRGGLELPRPTPEVRSVRSSHIEVHGTCTYCQ